MNIAVYCGSNPGTNPRFEQAAHQLGTWIAHQGHTLVYGGSAVGLMGTVSKAALAEGGLVYGVEPRFFIEAGVAQHDLSKLYVVETMSERKAKMIELSNVFITLPGGVGTLEEVSEIMSRIRLGLGPNECYFLNLDGFYDALEQFLQDMLKQNFIASADLERYHFARSVEELIRLIEDHAQNPIGAFVTATELVTPR